MRPFHPRLVAGTSNPVAGDFSAFTLKLDRDDGDQFLGDLTFKMPPGFTGNLRGSATARKLRSPPPRRTSAAPSRRARAARPRRRSARRTSPPDPASIRSTRSGKMYLAGPFKGAPLRWRRSRRRWPGPTTTASSSSGWRCTSIRSRPGLRRLRHGSLDHRRRPDPDALDPGQHRQAQFHDQPDQLRTRSRSTRRGSATRARSPTSAPTSRSSTARRCRSSRRCVDSWAAKEHERGQNPQLQFDLDTRQGDANIKSLSVTLSERLRDRPAPPRQHLLRERAGRKPVRRAHADRQGDARRRRCSTSRSPAPSTRSRARAACRGWPSSSTARSSSSRGPTRNGQRRPPEDHRAGRPRRPDRALPPDRLRRQTRLPGQHPHTLRQSAGGSVRYHGQNGKVTTQRVKIKTRCGKRHRRHKPHSGERNGRHGFKSPGLRPGFFLASRRGSRTPEMGGRERYPWYSRYCI